MDQKKQDIINNCVEKNISGKHCYIINKDKQEECKYCGLLKSTIKAGKEMKKSPYFSAQDLVMGKGEVSDKLFGEILKETGAKSAIVVTFDTLMIAPKSNLKGFKISSVNIQGKYLKTLFSFIGKALNGSLGGKLDVRVDKSNE